jgi:molybdate transport system ATP-binding protein
MSHVQLDITVRRGPFTLQVGLTSEARVLGVFGASGAGKTTLMQAIAGVVKPERGFIKIGDQLLFDSRSGIDLPLERRRVGMVFQDALLFPHLTVNGNLRYGLERSGRMSERTSEAPLIGFDAAVQLLNLGSLLDRPPNSLSGGEKQRVAIGRALLAAPRLLLLDEPLASLDEARKQDVLAALIAIRDAVQIPMLYISHVREEVQRLAQEIIVIEAGRIA